jgi:tetratricopeptide (TPR) repeat protein
MGACCDPKTHHGILAPHKEFRRALELNPKIVAAHLSLGVLALGRRDLETAEIEFQAERANHPGDPQARYHLAFVWLKREKTETALKLLGEVIKDKPDLPRGPLQSGQGAARTRLSSPGGRASGSRRETQARKILPEGWEA